MASISIDTSKIRRAYRSMQTIKALSSSFVTITIFFLLFDMDLDFYKLLPILIIHIVLWIIFSSYSFISIIISAVISVLLAYIGSVYAFDNTSSAKRTIIITITLGASIIFSNYANSVLLLNGSSREVLKSRRFLTTFAALCIYFRDTWRIKIFIAKMIDFIFINVRGYSNFISLCLIGMLCFNVVILLAHALDGTLKFSLKASDMGLIGKILLVHIAFILAVLVLSTIALKLKIFSRFLLRSAYDEIVKSNIRAPILFLRSFRNDQVTLPRMNIILRYWQALPEPQRLDHQLVENFSHLGPIVALGRPGENQLPYGAARFYVDNKKWRKTVRDFACRSQAIVVVAEDTESLRWEIRTMLSKEFVGKTLFLASPNYLSSGLENHEELSFILDRDNEKKVIVGGFFDQNHWVSFVSNQIVMEDYHACCKCFFHILKNKNGVALR